MTRTCHKSVSQLDRIGFNQLDSIRLQAFCFTFYFVTLTNVECGEFKNR